MQNLAIVITTVFRRLSQRANPPSLEFAPGASLGEGNLGTAEGVPKD
jgi:hypothetical protein